MFLPALFPDRKSKMLQCGMLERDHQALRKRSVVLCKQLVVDELLIQSLQADEILTESMAELILVCERCDMDVISFRANLDCSQSAG